MEKEYKRPSVTVDVTLFTYAQDRIQVLLIRRGNKPFAGKWALPGGFADVDEPLDKAAARELHEETGMANVISNSSPPSVILVGIRGAG